MIDALDSNPRSIFLDPVSENEIYNTIMSLHWERRHNINSCYVSCSIHLYSINAHH